MCKAVDEACNGGKKKGENTGKEGWNGILRVLLRNRFLQPK